MSSYRYHNQTINKTFENQPQAAASAGVTHNKFKDQLHAAQREHNDKTVTFTLNGHRFFVKHTPSNRSTRPATNCRAVMGVIKEWERVQSLDCSLVEKIRDIALKTGVSQYFVALVLKERNLGNVDRDVVEDRFRYCLTVSLLPRSPQQG